MIVAEAMGPLRILLADDHAAVRQGLRRILEERPDWLVVAEAGDGREAVHQAEEHRPDIAIIDIGMPLMNAADTIREIMRRVPGTRVLVWSMHSDEAYVTQMLNAGASGYLLKDSVELHLQQAVSDVSQGRSFVCWGSGRSSA